MAPPSVREELLAAAPRIARRAGLDRSVVLALIESLLRRVTVAPEPLYLSRLDEARRRVRDAKATGDEDYVAVALALNAPIWTDGKDFSRIPAVRGIRHVP